MRTIYDDPEMIDGYRVVQEYTDILDALDNKETVLHWEYGNSMYPMLKSGEYCLIKPIDRKIKVGDAVFCYVQNYLMVHMVLEINIVHDKTLYKIGTTDGFEYGWTPYVFGIAESTKIIHN